MSEREPSAFTDRLLDAARAESPGAAGKEATHAAVERGDAPAPPLVPPATEPWSRWASLRAPLVGVALVAAGAGWWSTRGDAPKATVEAPAAPRPAEPAPVAVAPVAAAEAPIESAREEPPPPAVEAIPAPAVEAKPRPKPPPAEVDDALARELKLLEAARGKLAGDPVAALAELDTHTKQFPRGAMVKEARLLRVEVLLKLGRRPDAEAVAAQLSAGDATPMLRERLKRLLEAP